jgi:hypothetical protein
MRNMVLYTIAPMNVAIFSCVSSDLCGKRCVFMVFNEARGLDLF